MSKTDEVAIKVTNVNKTFKLPHEKQNSIKGMFINIFNRKRTYEKQHVLNDISFEIKKGEFFGIVGRNGSGKSTLLKLLAGIYTPDSGHIQINGKLVPFIELGVGFNPELSGRENVFLNGALLGFNRKEMLGMYDEIVEFAELEKFMDQKLKNYSSGMQVRLAFSIAIRANTDILLLDEVLAVGDEAFQRKCEDYFARVKKDGKTIVLVTHSMDSVKRYCDKAILVRGGKIVLEGSPDDVANQYTQDNFDALYRDDKKGTQVNKKIPYFKIVPVSKKVLTNKDSLIVDIEYDIIDDTSLIVHIGINDDIRNVNLVNNGAKVKGKKGKNKLRYTLPLDIYNDCNLRVYAVIDEAITKKRIAYTSEASVYRCMIRNKVGNYGLISVESDVRGTWEDGVEPFVYNRNNEIHSA